MNKYKKILATLKETNKQLSTKDRQMSGLRLLCLASALLLLYQYFQTEGFIWFGAGLLALIAFGLVIKRHLAIRWESRFVKEKISVNENELAFLKGDLSAFHNGNEFIQHDHPYSYDLDFFGEHSLYQSLNRTSTVAGKSMLAKTLLHILPKEQILSNQEAVRELSSKLGWRQDLLALAHMNPDNSESYNELLEWSQKEPVRINSLVRVLSFILPVATLLSFGYYIAFESGIAGNISGLLFLINLGILASFGVSIKKELMDTTRIEKILKQYAFLLKAIENESFQSKKLKELQQRLLHEQQKASSAIHRLALLFGRMEHVANIFASPILNGSVLFHLHVLYHLSEWRRVHAEDIKDWLTVIGELEALSSLANFCYNNPSFTFPELNTSQDISFENLGHPLLPTTEAVTNSIDFTSERFFILTGSNMSGKSTFLRTIGVNMILAGIGAPVFASKAMVHPLPVHVSMRLSDSLTDSESYFYAEVKRLKAIMDQLEQEPCFVLLDEILRGTNSDDKRNGTIEVIRKMANKQAIGGIATHDLEVCNTTDEFPGVLTNKRFEVEIVENELVFDYKLRDGVCQNKSASFIMTKMGVI